MNTVADRVSEHSATAQRIQELESALAAAITYMRRLPPHPQTYHAAQAAETALRKEQGALHGQPLNVQWQTIDGITLIEGRLDGDRLEMLSPVMRPAGAAGNAKWQKMVCDALGRGLVIDFDAAKRTGRIRNQFLAPTSPLDWGYDQLGKSHMTQKEEFLQALERFADQVGLKDLLHVGLPRKPWFYLDLPEEPYNQVSDPIYHQAWWLLANLSGVINQPGLAPQESVISRALHTSNPSHHRGALEAYAGPRLSFTDLGQLFQLPVTRPDTEEAMLLVNLISSYRQLP
ncbi:hypothetical protein [Duganella vulcania]|uniref:Uncharacterized protein n=1 Tax=Duganella vulcania TaxID=2692166 RepID=A0A845GG15_9BURK|nr:hypothetical protein [Duganella vulcania]MYM92342.1 hypothetical protein [Duganella vulcania]